MPVIAAGEEVTLSRQRASELVTLSLGCTNRPYPNKPSHVYEEEAQVLPPRAITPAFYGCFDWHSAVHGHWAMVRILALYPDLPQRTAIESRLDEHLTPAVIERELAFFREQRTETFERPYGWGWLLRLSDELRQLDHPHAAAWRSALQPLVDQIASRTTGYLDRLSVPIRSGTHSNTAFALAHMLDYAAGGGHTELAANLERRALDFYRNDRACPTAYEPSGEDFVSPCLAEADVMRRILDAPDFVTWLDRFLPHLGSPEAAPLRHPVEIRDLQDPRIGHLIGLAFQRAWCFDGIASALPEGDPRVPVLAALARLHRREGVRQMFNSGYGGEHWLASFAIMAMTGPSLE
jgi:hypothetical protein